MEFVRRARDTYAKEVRARVESGAVEDRKNNPPQDRHVATHPGSQALSPVKTAKVL